MAKKKKEPVMKSWTVPYRLTTTGTACVEAETAEQAREMVDNGVFDDDDCMHGSTVDCQATGPAELNE